MIDEAYITLRKLGATKSHARYSMDFLGRSARYYDYLRCSQAAVSITALTTLTVRITNLADIFRNDARLSHKAEILDALADRLWVEVERRSYRDAWRGRQQQRRPARAVQGASAPRSSMAAHMH